MWTMPYNLTEKLLEVGNVGDTVEIEDSDGEFSTTTQSCEDVFEEMENVLRTYDMNLMYDSIEREEMKYESDKAHSSKEDKESVTDESEYESDISKSSCDNFEQISQAREDLWTSCQVIYTCMDNGYDVSKPSNVFRSKVEDFLRKFKNQITDDEKEFWKERKLVTHKALSTYKKKKDESIKSNAQDVIANIANETDLDVKNAPPPYDVVLFEICTKIDTDIAQRRGQWRRGSKAC